MLNKIMLIGNVGGEVTMRYTQGGVAVSNFSLATSEKFKGKDGNMQEETTWHRIVAWGRLAEICSEFLAKGSKVYVEGKLTEKKWTDNSGNERTSAEIIAREMKMLSGRGDSQSSDDHRYTPPSVGDDDQVPF